MEAIIPIISSFVFILVGLNIIRKPKSYYNEENSKINTNMYKLVYEYKADNTKYNIMVNDGNNLDNSKYNLENNFTFYEDSNIDMPIIRFLIGACYIFVGLISMYKIFTIL